MLNITLCKGMPNWYWYILIALLGKSAEFKFEMFARDQTFGEEKE